LAQQQLLRLRDLLINPCKLFVATNSVNIAEQDWHGIHGLEVSDSKRPVSGQEGRFKDREHHIAFLRFTQKPLFEAISSFGQDSQGKHAAPSDQERENGEYQRGVEVQFATKPIICPVLLILAPFNVLVQHEQQHQHTYCDPYRASYCDD